MEENKKVILIIGSAPFGGDLTNPTYEVAKLLNGTTYKDYVFRSAKFLPSRRGCIPGVNAAIEEHNPSIIIGVGLADNRPGVSLERVAVNVADFPILDNDGYLALNETLDPEGPVAYLSSLPIRACVSELRDAGIPAQVSNTAGNFCCNMAMYASLNYIAKHKLKARAGFVHVPYTPEMVAKKEERIPTMSFETIKRAVEIVAKAVVDYEEDISMVCGACS